MVKVLLPRHLRRFASKASGHRVWHLAGDADGIEAHGVGLLITRPFGNVLGIPWLAEAEYVGLHDWVVYAAPNRLTNPYVFDVRSAAEGRALARTYTARAKAIFQSIEPRRVAMLRKRMPYVKCAKCGEATDLFTVSDAEWAGVGARWAKEVLCLNCYRKIVA